MLFVKVMSIICAICRRVRETCLVTRLVHAHAEDDRLFFSEQGPYSNVW